jgi:hypothetical protein
MSLTSFVNQRDVREKLKQEFPKPKFTNKQDLLAPPLTKNYGLVGTAFDYLLRFYIKQINPQAIERVWIAESSVNILKKSGFNRFYEQGYLIVTQAREEYAKFLATQQLTDELIRDSLLLAKLDAFFRVGKIDENLQDIDEKDVEDLRSLMSLVDANLFKSSGVVLLNPTFGLASALVGGADADLLIDDLLIDVKNTKEFSLEREAFNQLIGYYTLFKIDEIDGAPPQHEVKRLGIYFSRYAYLHVIPVEDVIDESRFPQFLGWFEGRANKK